MALMDFLKRQFIDIIEWTDDSRDTLSYRFPDDDKEIKNGAQLIVRESQMVQFVAAGKYADIVAVQGDVLANLQALENVGFVMKGGVVYKGP